MALTDHKIDVFPGINDDPIQPTTEQGCNGSYLVAKHNAAMDEANATITALQNQVSSLINRVIILENGGAGGSA